MNMATSMKVLPPRRGSRDSVAGGICDLIAKGTLQPGQQMPTHEQLVTQFQVSRPTVRAALDLLEEKGVVRKTNSRSWVVAAAETSQGSLSSTVVIVGQPQDIAPQPGGSQGWWPYVQYGATQGLQAARLHRLLLDQAILDIGPCQQICQARPRGVIVLRMAAREAEPLVKVAQDYHIPIVIQGNDPEFETFDRVSSDHARGTYLLTKWLADHGCKRILRVWDVNSALNRYPQWLSDRDAGYESACRDLGLPSLPAVAPARPVLPGSSKISQAAFESSARYWAGWLLEHLQGREPIDGILTISDGPLFPIAAACRLLGREPGQDILLAGYDNYWPDSPEREWEPYVPAVTIDKNNIEVGRQLVDVLLSRSEGRLPPEPQHRVVEPTLVVNQAQFRKPAK